MFFSHSKSANSTFSHDLSAKQTGRIMSFGDVSVPKLVAYTGNWTWKVPLQLESPSLTHLKIQ
jgi:hypothetical protein